MAESFMDSGFSVHICDIDQDAIDEFLARSPGMSATLADVTLKEYVDKVFDDLHSRHGRLDVLINNAGIAGPVARAEEIEIEDWGTGIANPNNLFVPFFTTKPNGSGIGLPLCRQILENHQGYIQVGNAEGHQGCLVRLNLPATTHLGS